MFKGLKKIWQQVKKNVKEAKEFAKDDGVIRMPPAVFENEHETVPVDLNPTPCSPPSFGDECPGKGLKKIWQQVKKNVKEAKEFAKDDGVIRMPPAVFENEHETVPVDLNPTPCSPPSFGDECPGTSIDTEIAALVAEMNRVGIHTTCSCQGHDGCEAYQSDVGQAYIGIRLGDGTTYLYRKDIFGPGQDELTLKWRRKVTR